MRAKPVPGLTPMLVLLAFSYHVCWLKQADIVGNAAETAQHAAIIVAPVIVIAAFTTSLEAVQEHFSTDACGCASQLAHSHAASLSLEHTSQTAALLALHGHIGGGGDDSGEAGAASCAGGGAGGRHCPTHGALQNHRLLAHHRLLLVSHLTGESLSLLRVHLRLLRIPGTRLLILRLA